MAGFYSTYRFRALGNSEHDPEMLLNIMKASKDFVPGDQEPEDVETKES